MKRLISLIIVVFLVSLASQSVFARDKNRHPHPGTKEEQAEVIRTEENGGLFHYEPYLKNYLPLDLRYVNNKGIGRQCETDGTLVVGAKFSCLEYESPSTKEKFRIRHSGAEGLKVFTYKKATPILYASFTPNPEPWKGGQINEHSKVIYQSSEAEQYAQAHGDQNTTDVAVGKPVPTQTKPAEQTATVDCSKGTLFEKAQCLGKNPAIGAVINKLPSF